jgi:hypothetical protein
MSSAWPGRLLLLAALSAATAAQADGVVLARSKSGQFVVRGLPVGAPAGATGDLKAVDYVRLDPSVLTISLERIKTALLAELRQTDAWRGTIYVNVQPRLTDDQPITITSLRHPEGWDYRVTVPEIIPRDRYVRAVVQVLLMEMANRRAGERPAELPPWLGPGLAAQLLAEAPTFLIPELFSRTIRLQRPGDSLRPALNAIRAGGSLTLDQLNLPDDDYLDGPLAKRYESCARVLVVSLLRLKDGSGSLHRMIAQLPDHLNWQTSFLRAFSGHFQRLVDADKWWSLQVVRMTGQEPNRQWTVIETLQQLEDILDTPIEIRDGPDDLPTTTLAGLPALLQRCDFDRQEPLLRHKMEQLAALLPLAPSGIAGLIEDYRRTLDGYLRDRVPPKKAISHRHAEPPSARMVINATLQRLARLDARRSALLQAASEPRADFPVSPDTAGAPQATR